MNRRGPRRLDALDELDAERPGEPMRVQVGGVVVQLRPAADVPWRDLVAAVTNVVGFHDVFVPAEHNERIAAVPLHKMRALMAAYRIHSGLCATPDEDRRLASLLSRYRDAIEADLAGRVDVGELWRTRQWRRLLNLIDHLPRHSAYVEAMSEDEELAQVFVAEPDTDAPASRRVSEFSAEVEMTAAVVDRVGELIALVAAVNGAKIGKIRPVARPVTALDRVRKQQRHTRHRALVARVLPDKANT